jgi:hypothetical protein
VRGARASLFALIATLAGCSNEPFIELEIAERSLPFLVAGQDFDSLGVEAQADGCASVDSRYPSAPLPVTLTLARGACFHERLELRASAWLQGARVAESALLLTHFPSSGAAVVTATLTRLAR